MKQKLLAADRALVQSLELRSQPISCTKGITLFKQGDAPCGLYILKGGEANLLMESRAGRAVTCSMSRLARCLGFPESLQTNRTP